MFYVHNFSNNDEEKKDAILTAGEEENKRYLLEEQNDMELCIHSRNFLAGILVTTNIINAVNVSRRTVILLSG